MLMPISKHLRAFVLVAAVATGGCDTLADDVGPRLTSDGPASGLRVAIDGTTALVASPGNGPVAVYERGPGGWARTADLLGEGVNVGPDSPDRFGWAVALDGGVAVVGAYGADGGRGRAYVFERRGSGWESAAALQPDGLTRESGFGGSVAVGAERVFVSGSDTDGHAVFVYGRESAGWELRDTIRSPDPSDERVILGGRLATDGESLAVGGALVVSDTLTNALVHVYDLAGPYTSPTASLTTQIGYDELGGLEGRPRSDGGGEVAIDRNIVVVGVPSLNAEEGPWAGGAVVFERIDGVWSKPTRLVVDAPQTDDDAGRHGVAVEGGTVVVTSDTRDPGGAAFVFEKQGGAWAQTATLVAPDPAGDPAFGRSADLDGGRLIIGAPFEAGEDGAAYVYRRQGSGWVPDID